MHESENDMSKDVETKLFISGWTGKPIDDLSFWEARDAFNTRIRNIIDGKRGWKAIIRLCDAMAIELGMSSLTIRDNYVIPAIIKAVLYDIDYPYEIIRSKERLNEAYEEMWQRQRERQERLETRQGKTE